MHKAKRDIHKIRDEVNSLTVKSAAHDVDIGKNCDDLRKLERQRAEDQQRLTLGTRIGPDLELRSSGFWVSEVRIGGVL